MLYGATSDPIARPVGQMAVIRLGERQLQYLPLISIDPSAARSRVPLTLQYILALRRLLRAGQLADLDVLDFHRIEPCFLFRRDRRPKNLTLHQDMSVIRDKDSDIQWRHFPWLYVRIEEVLFRDLSHIFVVRESAVDRYRGMYPRMAQKFSFMPTWVDTGVFGPMVGAGVQARDLFREKLRIASDIQVLVFVGRLDRQKDPLLLLEAFRLVLRQRGDLHLVIVGDGLLRPKVEAALQDDELRGRVSLTGALSRHTIAETLRSADLFVMSSAYEGMPIAVLEALATGVPVVSTNVGEMRRIVQDGVNGCLSASRTAASLSDAMLRSLSGLQDMRGRPCEASVEPYHPEKVLGQIYDNHRRQVQERLP